LQNSSKNSANLTKLTRLDTIKKTLFVGKEFYHFPELASTNQYAIGLSSKSKPSEGTVISTYKQVQGKGQAGSKWESEPDKNIAMSLILHPKFVVARDQFVLNQAISLGVLDFVKNYISSDAKIKWSNDIYIFDKKVAGILIQNTLFSRNIQSSIVGVGININQTIFKSDAPNPTSFSLETGNDFDLDELLEMLCWKIEMRYLQLKANATEKIKAEYLDNLYRYMEDALYQVPGEEVFQGRIIGIGEFGKLLVQTKSGLQEFDTKQVKFII
jgi:BirA family biotin operon repressor/biotin-[acetyl-CoA-carboxylase] ligase